MSRIERHRLVLMMAALGLIWCTGVTKGDSIAVRVSATSDDAEERLGDQGMESLDSSDLELGSESPPNDSQGGQLVGMRFLNVDISAGSTINSASIQFTVDENDKNDAPASYVIFGELSPNPETFTSASGNISSRTPATNIAVWSNVPSWTGQIGNAGPDQLTPDLSAIVQEIIDQAGWAAGNAMAFGMQPLAAENIDANRTAESFDGVPTSAALLQVDFTPIPEPSSIVLAMLGFVALAAFCRRRTK